MDEAVRMEIECLQAADVNTLRARYREVFGHETESTSHTHLLRRIAWRLQAAAEGDLTERARQRAAELIADAELRLHCRRKPRVSGPVRGHEDARIPCPGTVLEREFRGEMISVRVLEGGRFEFHGSEFESLSAIAQEVTGTRWNGFAFFRLNRDGGNA